MSDIICSCGDGFKNSALPSCEELINRIVRFALIPIFDSEGVKNGIDTTQVLDETFWDALQFNADKSKRLYPIPFDLINVEHTRTDTKYKTYNDDSKVRLGPGIRSFTALGPAHSNKYLKFLLSAGCGTVGVYFFDASGKVIGWNGGSDDSAILYPLPLAKQTLDAFMTWANDENPQEINIMWDFDKRLKDQDWSWIDADLMDYDVFNLTGMFDVVLREISKSATTLVIGVKGGYGGVGDPDHIPGLLNSNFILTNTTDSLAVTETVAEGVNQYTLTFTAQGSGDGYSLVVSKAGLESNTLIGTFAV